jgi:hypothetical protein
MTGKMTDCCQRLQNVTCVTCKSDETCLFLNIHDLVKVLLFVDTLSWWNRTKLWVPLVLTDNADDSDKLPPHRIGKCKSPHCFKNVKTFQKTIMQVQIHR